jgi:hypothetical protein
VLCFLCPQEEVLARSQSKQFYQHLITLFQHLKTRLVTSRPCFLLPRAGVNGTSASASSYHSAGGGLLAVSCALDDDLVHADEVSCLGQQTAVMSLGPEARANSEAGGNNQQQQRLGSYNIFSGNSQSSGKPGLGVFIAGGSGSNGVPVGSQSPALVVAAGPHQVLLPADSAEGERSMLSCAVPSYSLRACMQDLLCWMC